MYALLLLTLAADRARALRDPAAYKKALARAPGRHKCYVFAFWVVAAAAASPLFYLFKNWPFPDRLSCQVKANCHFPLDMNGRSGKLFNLPLTRR